MPGIDYVIRVIPLPKRINGFVTYDDEARANIYINENISDEQKRQAYQHEMRHIRRNDTSNGMEISAVERG